MENNENEDERRFTYWFQINGKPGKVEDITINDYAKLKRSNEYAYEFATNHLLHILDDGEEMKSLFKSNDDVDYIAVSLPIAANDLIEKSVLQLQQDLHENPEVNDSFNDVSANVPNLPSTSNYKSKLTAFRSDIIETSGSVNSNISLNISNQTQSRGRQPSMIWKHVRVIKEGGAPKYFECNYCKKQYKYTTCTTNMMKHLSKMHSFIVDESNINNQKNSLKQSSNKNQENFPNKKLCLTNSSNDSTPNIRNLFDRIQSFQAGSGKEKITDLILFMMCRDLQPFAMANNEGFNIFIKYICPHYSIPSRQTFVRRMEQKYSVMKELVRREIADKPCYCITADNWSDCSNSDYIGVTVHYLMDDLRIKTINLGVVPLHERHTAEYLKNTIIAIFTKFGVVLDNISAFITDGESAIKKAARDIVGVDRHLVCIAHVLSKLIPESLDKCEMAKEIIVKVKSIVTLIRRSIPATKRLQTDQSKDVEDSGSVLNLLQEVPTRWTSTNNMLERYVFLQKYLYAAMSECSHPIDILNREEIQIINDILKFTRPICNVITELSGERYPTSSLAIPLLHCLKLKIETETPNTEVGHQFKKELLLRFQDSCRFGLIEQYRVAAISTILDPRFKKIHFENALSVTKALTYIDKQLEKQENNGLQSDKNDVDPPSPISVNEASHWEIHEKLLHEQKKKPTSLFSRHLELQQYLELDCIHRTENIFAYWMNMKQNYPNLAKIALRHLTALSSTVPSERLFSRAKLVKRHNRNKLTARHLNILVFLSSFSYNEWNC